VRAGNRAERGEKQDQAGGFTGRPKSGIVPRSVPGGPGRCLDFLLALFFLLPSSDSDDRFDNSSRHGQTGGSSNLYARSAAARRACEPYAEHTSP